VKERVRHLGPLAGLLALIAFPGSALAATGSQTFTTTGENVFVVPAGVTSVQVTLVGGNGGSGFASGGNSIPGGRGGTALATIAVRPGDTLYAEVAGDGSGGSFELAGAGGSGGGARGGVASFAVGAGGGGGASDVRSCAIAACSAPAAALASRLVVAGGGGGGGNGSHYDDALGGPGGDAGGAGTGGAAADSFPGGGGGQAGGQTTGGTGGTNGAGGNAPGGSLGTGGHGADGDANDSSFGGGGGGGLYGGGGGGLGEYGAISNFPHSGAGGGGGGGSSGVPPGAPGVSGFGTNPTPAGSEPQITFAWTLPPPAAVTGTPTGVSGTSATLTGTVNPDGSVITDCHFTVSNGTSVPCQQQVGSGSTPTPVTASIAGLQPGRSYTATLVAGSAQGTSSGAPVTFTTSAGPAPVLSNLTIKPKRLRRKSGKTKKKAPLLPAISFQATGPATAKLTIAKQIKGRRVGKRCVAHGAKRGRRCTTYKPTKYTLTLPVPAGANQLSFGAPHGPKLRPGTYRVSLTATGPAGQSSNTLSGTFTIVR
jgi:hypothetical protein